MCTLPLEFLSEVNMKTVVFWDLLSCSLGDTDVSDDLAASIMSG